METYYSSNLNVASVSKTGEVTTRATGSCVIYVLANNGVRAEVKITVTRQEVPETEVTYNGGIYRLNKAKTAAVFAGPEDRNATKLTIAATMKIGGKTYKVKEIAKNACKSMKNLKTLVIGKNVETIGKQAFYNCGSLKSITLKTEKLTEDSIGANAFGKGAKKPTVKCPKSMLKKYTLWMKKKGLTFL